MKEELAHRLTPIFDKPMGERMELARMKMKLSQAELAKMLGVSQSQVSKLENGTIQTPRLPFSYFRMQAVFGELTTFIVLGSNAGKINPREIHRTYWDTRLKGKQKPRDPDERATCASHNYQDWLRERTQKAGKS